MHVKENVPYKPISPEDNNHLYLAFLKIYEDTCVYYLYR
jgi:hypothetical protein